MIQPATAIWEYMALTINPVSPPITMATAMAIFILMCHFQESKGKMMKARARLDTKIGHILEASFLP
jgi:hypothetical protein